MRGVQCLPLLHPTPAFKRPCLCSGFSSPGNSGISEPMKNAGRDKEVAWNEECALGVACLRV